MKRLVTIFYLLIVMLLSVNAQNICGRLLDYQDQPLAYANVVLLSLPDSTFIDGVITDDKGCFALFQNNQGKLLRISSIGYTTIYCDISSHNPSNTDLGVLYMKPEIKILDEVSVKVNLPNVYLKGDAMVTNVSGTILENAGTAELLLDKIPNVTVHGGVVSVFGRGIPEIYINGRKVRDNMELDQISSENIKSVEVVNNPGALYSSSVKAIIRIVTKNTEDVGFGLNNRMVVQNHRYGWTCYDQLNINYRKKGFDLAGMFSIGHYNNSESKIIETNVYSTDYWRLSNDMTKQKKLSQNFSGTFFMNYQLNEKHIMGVRYRMLRDPKTSMNGKMYTDNYRNNEIYESSEAGIDLFAQNVTHNGNFYYTGQINDWDINLNVDGMWQMAKSNDYTDQIITTALNEKIDENVQIFNWNRNKLFAGKLIISHPLFGGNLSFGGEYSHNSRINSYLNDGGKGNNDYSEIREGIISSFLDYGISFGNVNLQAGLRYEHVDFDYYFDGVFVPNQSKKYKDLFPSLAINIPIGNLQTQISYSGDITRPSYRDLRSNITYANRYLYEKGNPFLLPVISENFMFSASYKWVYFNMGYQRIKNDISQFSSPYVDENPSISLFTVVNMPDYDLAIASLTLSPKINIWQPQLNLNIEKQWYKAETPDGNSVLNHPVVTIDWQNIFNISENCYLGLNASWRSCGHVQNSYIEVTQWGIDLLAYKSFFKDRCIAQLHINDLFNTKKNKITTYSGNRVMTWDYQTNRSIQLSLRYIFNSAKIKYKGTGAGDSQKSRM